MFVNPVKTEDGRTLYEVQMQKKVSFCQIKIGVVVFELWM